MSDILAEFARVRGASGKPTVRLLDRKKWAPVVLAICVGSGSETNGRLAAQLGGY